MKNITNLVLFAITMIVSLLVAEISVRYIYDDVTTTRDNSSYFSQRWFKSHPATINQSGFRERNYSTQKTANTYRVAVVGDSFTYGQGIVEDARFTNIIQHHLDNMQVEFEVLNFGRPGAETVDQTAFLDQYIFELEPDFVLLQWFINDVGGHSKAGQSHPYPLIPSRRLEKFLHKHSALYYLINSKWRELQVQAGLIKSHEESMFGMFGDPDSDDSIRASRELDEFILRVKEKNIAMGIVLFPPLVETGGLIEAYPYSYLFDRMISACRQHAMECLDLRPVFAKQSPALELWANRFDSHPGPLANKLAANAILNRFMPLITENSGHEYESLAHMQ